MTDYADLINQLLKRHERMQSRGTFTADPPTADLIKQAADAIAALVKERDTLRTVCAETYQYAGCMDAPVEVLDNLSDAANGEPLRHPNGFLPISANLHQDSYQRGLRDGERIGLEKAAKVAAEYGDRMATNIEKQRAKLQPGTVYEHKLDAAEAIESEIRALITPEQER